MLPAKVSIEDFAKTCAVNAAISAIVNKIYEYNQFIHTSVKEEVQNKAIEAIRIIKTYITQDSDVKISNVQSLIVESNNRFLIIINLRLICLGKSAIASVVMIAPFSTEELPPADTAIVYDCMKAYQETLTEMYGNVVELHPQYADMYIAMTPNGDKDIDEFLTTSAIM